MVHDLPGNWVGSVRVESQEWLTPGGPLVLPPNIVAVATLIKYADAQRTETREAIAYNLLPEHKMYDWQLGVGGGGLDSGVGLIAIPSLLKDLDGTGVTTRAGDRERGAEAGLHGLRDLHLRPERAAGLRVPEAEREAGGVHRPADVGLHQPRVQGLGDHLGGRSGSTTCSTDDGLLPAQPGGSGRGGDRAVEDDAGRRTSRATRRRAIAGIPFRQSDIEDEEFDFSVPG